MQTSRSGAQREFVRSQKAPRQPGHLRRRGLALVRPKNTPQQPTWLACLPRPLSARIWPAFDEYDLDSGCLRSDNEFELQSRGAHRALRSRDESLASSQKALNSMIEARAFSAGPAWQSGIRTQICRSAGKLRAAGEITPLSCLCGGGPRRPPTTPYGGRGPQRRSRQLPSRSDQGKAQPLATCVLLTVAAPPPPRPRPLWPRPLPPSR